MSLVDSFVEYKEFFPICFPIELFLRGSAELNFFWHELYIVYIKCRIYGESEIFTTYSEYVSTVRKLG